MKETVLNERYGLHRGVKEIADAITFGESAEAVEGILGDRSKVVTGRPADEFVPNITHVLDGREGFPSIIKRVLVQLYVLNTDIPPDVRGKVRHLLPGGSYLQPAHGPSWGGDIRIVVRVEVSKEFLLYLDHNQEAATAEMKECVLNTLYHELTHALEELARKAHGKGGLDSTSDGSILNMLRCAPINDIINYAQFARKCRTIRARMSAKGLTPELAKKVDDHMQYLWVIVYNCTAPELRARVAQTISAYIPGATREERLAALKSSSAWDTLLKIEQHNTFDEIRKMPEYSRKIYMDTIKLKLEAMAAAAASVQRSKGFHWTADAFEKIERAFRNKTPEQSAEYLQDYVRKAAKAHKHSLLRTLAFDDPGPTLHKPWPKLGIPTRKR